MVINRARNAWKQPMAVECERCRALCVSEEALAKHADWHAKDEEIVKREGAAEYLEAAAEKRWTLSYIVMQAEAARLREEK